MLDALHALGGRGQRAAIKRKAVALGSFTDEQLEIPPPPSQLAQYPNLLNYQLDWALNALHRRGRVRRPRRVGYRLATRRVAPSIVTERLAAADVGGSADRGSADGPAVVDASGAVGGGLSAAERRFDAGDRGRGAEE